MYKDSIYTNVFDSIKANKCKFTSNSADIFLQSLSDDGYDEWQRLVSDRIIQYIKKSERSRYTSIAKTGFIYYEPLDCYYNICIHRSDDDIYEIEVEYCPMTFIQSANGDIEKKL